MPDPTTCQTSIEAMPPSCLDVGALYAGDEVAAGPVLLQALDHVYRAAEAPEHWSVAVAQTAKALDACAAGFVHCDRDGRWTVTTWHERSQCRPATAAGTLDETLGPLLERLRGMLPGRVLSAPANPPGADRALAISLSAPSGRGAAFLALRTAGNAAFGAQERALAAGFAPHLRRALALAAQRRRAASLDGVLRGLLGLPARGAVTVDSGARVLHVVGTAERLCEEGDGLGIEDGRLVASAAASTAELQRAVRDAAGSKEPVRRALSLPRGGDGEALEVLVVSLPAVASDGPLFDDGPSHEAAVIVADALQRGRVDARVLRRIHGFTPAEAWLAQALAAGQTLEDAAAAAGLTRETMRSRLKGLFRKTGTRRQADLVARLLSGVATFDCPPG